MTNNTNYPSDITEATADFTKTQSIANKDFLKAKKGLVQAKLPNMKRMFLNYCLAVVEQKNLGVLTIREASYAISNCTKEENWDDQNVKEIILKAGDLQRHPANYKANHDEGWNSLVKSISTIRRKIR